MNRLILILLLLASLCHTTAEARNRRSRDRYLIMYASRGEITPDSAAAFFRSDKWRDIMDYFADDIRANTKMADNELFCSWTTSLVDSPCSREIWELFNASDSTQETFYRNDAWEKIIKCILLRNGTLIYDGTNLATYGETSYIPDSGIMHAYTDAKDIIKLIEQIMVCAIYEPLDDEEYKEIFIDKYNDKYSDKTSYMVIKWTEGSRKVKCYKSIDGGKLKRIH